MDSEFFEGFRHPERKPGEVFFGNGTEGELRYIPFKEKRVGYTALDINGKVIPDMIPIFVSAAEAEVLG